MDDCNRPGFRFWLRFWLVQIPLWTIVTTSVIILATVLGVQIPLWTIVTIQIRRSGYQIGVFRFLYGRL